MFQQGDYVIENETGRTYRVTFPEQTGFRALSFDTRYAEAYSEKVFAVEEITLKRREAPSAGVRLSATLKGLGY